MTDSQEEGSIDSQPSHKFSRAEVARHIKAVQSLVERTNSNIQKQVSNYLGEQYLTMTQARILSQLFFKGREVSLKELQIQTKFSQPAISKYTRDLEERGILTRKTLDNISYIAKLNETKQITTTLIDRYITTIFSQIVRLLQDEIDNIDSYINKKGPLPEEADEQLQQMRTTIIAKQREIATLVMWAENLKKINIPAIDAVQSADIDRILQSYT